MAPGVIPLRRAIAGIEVCAKPSVANRWVAERTMRSRVEAGAASPAAALARLGRAGGCFVDRVFGGALFIGCQSFGNAAPIQARSVPHAALSRRRDRGTGL